MTDNYQPRHRITDGVRFLVQGKDRALCPWEFSFDTYDQADKYLDDHENVCPDGHVIYRTTVMSDTEGKDRVALETLRELAR